MAQKLVHKRSSQVDKAPTGNTLDYGEIAINYNAASPFLSIKNHDNTYSKFSSDKIITEYVTGELKGYSKTGHTHNYSEIKNAPTSLKNPNAITFQTGTTTVGEYDGSSAATIKIPSSTDHLTNDSGYITSGATVAAAKVADSVAWTGVTNKANATTATTGIVKLVTGDMKNRAHADGQAPSLNHTHSQYAAASHSHGTIKLQGDVTGSASFTNTGATINTTVTDNSHTHISSNITDSISAGSGITSTATTLVQGKAVYEYAAPKSHTHGTIKLQGDVTGSASFTNTGATIDATVVNDSHTHGSTSITGKITAGTGITSAATGLVDGNAVYEYAQPKGNYQIAGEYAPKEHTHTITATANDDDVVVLSGTDGSNAVTYTASHATQGPNTKGDTVTTVTSTAQFPAHGGKINLYIPKITVNKYGHVTSLSDQAVAVMLPSDSNTHYTTRIYAGASGTAANAAASNPYLKVTDDNTYRNQVRFVGGGATSVASDSAGTITISTPAETYTKHEDTSELSGSYGTITTNGSHAVKQITVDGLGHVTGIITGTTPDTKYSFSNNNVTLKWDTKSTIANVGGTDITVTMPANPNTNTHYISKNIVGASSTAAANAAATNGNVWLNHTEEGVVKSSHNIKGAGATTVTSDSAGTITISSTDTKYTSLKNPYSLTVGSKAYDGSAAVTITASDLGLAAALKYCGVTTTALYDGATTNPITINNASHTATQGCVVFYGDKEFVFNGTAWELLGAEATYKVVQSAVSSPTNASGNATAFIDTITQNANGVISVTKKNVDFSAYQPKGNYKTIQTAVSSPNASGNATAFIDTISQNANGVITATKRNVDFSPYVNQNAYSNVKVGTTTVAANNATDTLTLSAGTNVQISADVNSDTITISSTDTNTWRPVYNDVDSTDTSSAATANAVKKAYDKAVSAYNLASGKTSNVGTVTSVTVTGGTGLSGGGTVTSSGTITLNHAAAYTGSTLTKSTSGANYYLTAVTLSMDGLGHVTGLSGSESYDDDANTHYTTRLYAGASGTATHSAVTNPYLKVTDDNTYRNQVRFVGGGATTITSDSAGTITITSTDTNTDTNYYLTGVSGNGNGTVTFTRQGLSNLTWNASHNHSGVYAAATHSHAASAITGGTSGYFLKADSNGNGVWTSVTIPSAYTLPTASSSTKGGVKVGSFLSISSEVLSVLTGTSSTTVARGDHNHSGVYQPAGSYAAASHSHTSSNITDSISAGSGIASTATTLVQGKAVYEYAAPKSHTHSQYLTKETYKGTVTSVKVTGGTGLSSGGTITSSGTITINHAAATTATTFGSTGKYIEAIKLDGLGHVTGVTTGTPLTGSYLPLSGGTLTGNLRLSGSSTYGNSIYFGDGEKAYISEAYDNTLLINGNNALRLQSGSNTLVLNPTIMGVGAPLTLLRGDLRLSGSSTYGTSIYFGDGEAAYISEPVDDKLLIYGVKGVELQNSNYSLNFSDGGLITNAPMTGTTMQLSASAQTAPALTITTGSIVMPDDYDASIRPARDNYGTIGTPTNAFYEGYINKIIADSINADTINADTAFYQISDERLKDFCNEIEVDFDKLKEIPKSYFTWKSDEDKKLQIGTSAQKVKELYPELVGGTEEDTLCVDYSKLSIVALKAVDVLHEENEKLKSIIEKMDERITQLEKKLGE